MHVYIWDIELSMTETHAQGQGGSLLKGRHYNSLQGAGGCMAELMNLVRPLTIEAVIDAADGC